LSGAQIGALLLRLESVAVILISSASVSSSLSDSDIGMAAGRGGEPPVPL